MRPHPAITATLLDFMCRVSQLLSPSGDVATSDSLASFDGCSGLLLLRRCNVIRKEMRKLITLCVSKMLDFHVQILWPLSEESFHYEIRTGFTMSASRDQHDVFLL